MIHETRIIPLDGRPALPATFKSYMGDSRGRWEGNTLVVRTTNLNGKNGLQANGQLMLDERRDGADRALHADRRRHDCSTEVTINDPKTWTRPWKVAFPLRREPDYQIFEYACHEGNYSMRNTLSGSRADEGQTTQKPSPPTR